MDELISKSACEIVELLRTDQINTDDTLAALAARIETTDAEINALPTLCLERARAFAQQAEQKNTILAGIPIAIKDLTDVAGVRTTYGSILHENHVPRQSDIIVEQIESSGGVIYAKSNTPEFATGGNTFNDVFGATLNPYDLTRSAGGSSGGAAAALASGCAWLAQGSDLGGSLRTPASFCGVTSLRPSPGLIATSPGLQPFDVYSQAGPMARCVSDLALFADAMTGLNDRAGISKPQAGNDFQSMATRPVKPLRIAFSEDLGVTQLSAEVAAVCKKAIAMVEREAIQVEHCHPNLSMAETAFAVPRALGYAQSFGADLANTRAILKPEIVWNIEMGLNLSGDEIRRSQEAQTQVFLNAIEFMQDFDLLICPATILPAYPVEERYPGYSEGLDYSEYYRWLAICCAITTTTLPVITLPCGKTDTGLPVGLQLVGKAHGELQLFAFARYLEQIFDWDPLQLIH